MGAMVGKADDRRSCRWDANAALTRPIRASILAILLASGFSIVGSASCLAQFSRPDTRIDFKIPAQPLARALVAYGAATGLEVFYNAALAESRRSAEVTGSLTATVALQTLLRGTGYVARTTGPGSFTIVRAPPEEAVVDATLEAERRLYEPYFATIQAQISDVLCRSGGSALERSEILVRFWIAPSGVVARAEAVGDDGELADDQTFAIVIRGVAVGAPPAGMPQPVDMVIFPPFGAPKGCRPANGQQRAG
jgi:hypothetical protein